MMPGGTESEHGIFNAILRGQVDFTSDPWPRISHGAKDLVRKMLNPDPKQRISAYDVLSECSTLFVMRWTRCRYEAKFVVVLYVQVAGAFCYTETVSV